MEALPESSIIKISSHDADLLLNAAENQPAHDDLAYYDPQVLLTLYRGVRNLNPVIFDKIINVIKTQIKESPYCVIVRGLRFDAEKRLYLAIARGLGNFIIPPYKEPRARFVHQISPSSDLALKSQVLAELLHTDGADQPEPPGYITMLCHRPDPLGGGRSRLMTCDAIRQEIETQLGRDVLVQTESEEMPWQMADYLGGYVFWRPIIQNDQLCWRKYTIEAANKNLETPLPEETFNRLDTLGSLFENSQRSIEFLLEQGDFMVADNLRTLHGRTALSNHPQAGERLMFRNWIHSFEVLV